MVRYDISNKKNKREVVISTAHSYIDVIYCNDRRNLFGTNIHNQQRHQSTFT